MKQPQLYIFAGLPGSGKTTLAKQLAASLGAVYLRIDTLEQGLRELCQVNPQGEGYGLAWRLATDNLRLGLSVVADSCNPIQLSRDEWQQVAIQAGAEYINIEVMCSDVQQHRSRVETREATIVGQQLPDWQAVCEREYHPWATSRIQLDTAGKTVAQSLAELEQQLGTSKHNRV